MNLLLKIATYVAILIFDHSVFGQNLIPNPGFEEFVSCPDGLRQLNRAKHWQEANSGTPELFHDCGFTSLIRPFEGEGMAGVILLCDYDNGVEYLQVKLTDTLQKGKHYCLSYYIKVDAKTPIAINKMGAHFSKERLYTPNWTPFRKFPNVKSENIIGDNNGEWEKVEGSFLAKGGEAFMTFGNFYARYYLEEKQIQRDMTNWSSYYYLDNFQLYENEAGCDAPYKSTLMLPEAEIVWSHSVYFAVDKFEISSEEQLRLNKFIRQLPDNLFQPIKLIGHTDSDAELEYNYQLSQSRAQAVSEFIKAKGLQNTYLSWSGEESPLNRNKNKSEKALNRRVEIIIQRP